MFRELGLQSSKRVVEWLLLDLSARRIVESDAKVGEPSPLGPVHGEIHYHSLGPLWRLKGDRARRRALRHDRLHSFTATDQYADFRPGGCRRKVGNARDRTFPVTGQLESKWRLCDGNVRRESLDSGRHYYRLVGALLHVPPIHLIDCLLLRCPDRPGALVPVRHSVRLMEKGETPLTYATARHPHLQRPSAIGSEEASQQAAWTDPNVGPQGNPAAADRLGSHHRTHQAEHRAGE
jgi:hypothetical protein